MTDELSGKVALVSGASRGLGRAIAEGLAKRGAQTAINFFGSSQLAADVARTIRDDGGIASVFQADVRDEGEVKQMVAEVEAEFGPIDIVVINATGPQPFIPIEKLSWQAMLDQLDFFVKSPMLLVQQAVGQMKRRRSGRIINIGSEVFDKGVPEFSNYVAAKGAQLGLTRSWALELAPFGITVNLVAPGWIPTERHANDPQEAMDAYAASVPMKHMGQHQDIAMAVAFLAGEGGRFITGQKLSVNGGNTLG